MDAVRRAAASGPGGRYRSASRRGRCLSGPGGLCTGNEKLSTIGQDLERLGVPVLFLGSLFERAEVKDLLALLSVLVDRRAMGLVRIACWPDFTMSFADVAAIFEHLRAAEHARATGSSMSIRSLASAMPAAGARQARGRAQRLRPNSFALDRARDTAARSHPHRRTPWRVRGPRRSHARHRDLAVPQLRAGPAGRPRAADHARARSCAQARPSRRRSRPAPDCRRPPNISTPCV